MARVVRQPAIKQGNGDVLGSHLLGIRRDQSRNDDNQDDAHNGASSNYTVAVLADGACIGATLLASLRAADERVREHGTSCQSGDLGRDDAPAKALAHVGRAALKHGIPLAAGHHSSRDPELN